MEGKAAPAPLLVVQAFANTIDVEDEIDWLDSVEEAERWLRETGLGSPKLRVTPALLGPAKELREVIRALLAANEQGKTDRKAATALGALASQHRIPLRASADGELEVDLSPADSADDLLAQMLGIVFEAQATDTWPRLKLCENDECAWAFYDSSRNRSGSWCRMGACGNRLKNRAYRERKRKDGA